MKKLFAVLATHFSTLCAVLVAVFFTAMAYAQDVAISPVSETDFIGLLFQSLGGLKGASALSIAFVLAKLAMAFWGTPWAETLLAKAGAWKFTIAALLNLIIGFLGLLVAGVTWQAALVHSTVLGFASVFFNQMYKQFIVKQN